MEKDYQKVWSKCLDLIREHVAPKSFMTWFQPIVAVGLQGSVLRIQVKSQYVYECLEEHYVDVLRMAIRSVLGANGKLEYSVVVEESQKGRPNSMIISSTQSGKMSGNGIDMKPEKGMVVENPFERKTNRLEIDPQLHASYTMENFVEGNSNCVAKASAMAIAKSPGKTAFNPFLIYGGSGLGKTHLAQAIGWEVKQNYPDKVVLYVTTNVFQRQFTEAQLKNEINNFLHFYQLIDVLILDDIQELAGKRATQNTFFHIFDELHRAGKQLILTSDRSPADLKDLEERLLTRFRWGLSVEMQVPDFETRLQIARFKARKEGFDFSDEILACICKYVDSNIRELEGAMNSLLAQTVFTHQDLTPQMVQDFLGKMIKDQKPEMTVERIEKVVCDYFNIEPEVLQSKTRKREIVQARQLAMYFCKNYTNASLAYIGKQIGRKDHTTVLYACKAVADLLETDRTFRSQVEELQQKLYCRS